jgi:hypothetical protein
VGLRQANLLDLPNGVRKKAPTHWLGRGLGWGGVAPTPDR